MIKINDTETSIDFKLKKLKVNKALVDFDGVIVNSEPIHNLSYKYILYKIGIDASKFNFTKYIGNNEKVIWAKIIIDYKINNSENGLYVLRNKFVNELILNQKPSWFILSILEFYKNRDGCTLISSGNGNVIKAYLKKWNLNQYFDETIMSFDFNTPINKSNILLSKITESKENIVVIEDSVSHSIESLKNNAKVIWIKHSLNSNSSDTLNEFGIDLTFEQ